MTAAERARRTSEADALCARAFETSQMRDHGVALVAVGGYGRGELAPFSDLDIVLVHEEGIDVASLAERLWYPLWDAGFNVDHSVRSVSEMLTVADSDIRVAMGLLDIRHLAGDPGLTLQLRTLVLANWRKNAPSQLPLLRQLTSARHELMGELAHAAIPDLKESAGGLRDATVLRAVVATWLVDVPHTDLEHSRTQLLDVRDVIQGLANRQTDRVLPEFWSDLADRLGLADARAAQSHVREIGRRITHLTRLTWRRVDAYLHRPAAGEPRRPRLSTVAAGVAVSDGEITLTAEAVPADDPILLLRAAVAAAESGLVLAPPTAARLAHECPPLPTPWPLEARQLLVRLLGSGLGLLDVWETLEETGAIDQFLPEWERIRLLPHASAIHRFTVDRHSIETCIEASTLVRQVGRPDVLLIAALLHDIGKGSLTEHSIAGAPIAREIVSRIGFEDDAVDLVTTLVRWHLLLANTATTRDPEDPATIRVITDTFDTVVELDLLTALTEADARATSPKAWSSWRSRLILDLAAEARLAIDSGIAAPERVHSPVEIPSEVRRGGVSMKVESLPDGSRVEIIAQDRVGLMADVSAAFALLRVPIRAVRAWGQDRFGLSVWDIGYEQVDPTLLRERFDAISDGRLNPAERLAAPDADALEPNVVVRPEASTQATVLEVRTQDRPGVLYLVASALARMDVTVRSAHVDTLGPQAVDVFYLQEAATGPLSEERAVEAARAVRLALSGESQFAS